MSVDDDPGAVRTTHNRRIFWIDFMASHIDVTASSDPPLLFTSANLHSCASLTKDPSHVTALLRPYK